MKQFLLFILVFTWAFSAQAQVNSAIVNGLGLATRLAMRGGPSQQKADAFTTQATYQAQAFPQKRTPARKLPKADVGGTEVTAIELLLSTRYAALQADSTSVLLGMDQEKEFSRLRNNAFNPAWNADAYLAEMDFYRQQDVLRKRRAASIAK